jgi:hypothetical protein
VSRARQKVQGDREAWRSVLDDLIRRRLRGPECLFVDGGAAALWPRARPSAATCRHSAVRPQAARPARRSPASKKPEIASSPLLGDGGVAQPPLAQELPAVVISADSAPGSGKANEPPTPSSGCSRSSCTHQNTEPPAMRPKLPPCGPRCCWRPGGSPWGKSSAGKRFRQKSSAGRVDLAA